MKKAIEWWQHVYYPEFSQAKFEEEEEIIAKQGYKELSTNISRLIAVESRDAMQTLNLQLLDELDQKVFEIREAQEKRVERLHKMTLFAHPSSSSGKVQQPTVNPESCNNI